MCDTGVTDKLYIVKHKSVVKVVSRAGQTYIYIIYYEGQTGIYKFIYIYEDAL